MDLGTEDENRLVGEDRQRAADEAKPEVPRRFVVKLMQTAEVCTEQFTEVNGEALSGSKKDALQKVQNFIDDEKELEGEYRLVVEEIEPLIDTSTPVDNQPASESSQ